MTRRVAVVGAGAIGGVVAGSLARARVTVDVIERAGVHQDVLRERGLRVERPDGAFEVRVARVLDPRDDLGRLEIVFLAVKGQATADIGRLLTPHLAEDGVVVTLQNGLTFDAAAAVFGAGRVVPAMVHLAAQRPEPGLVRAADGELRVGEPDGRRTERVGEIAALLAAVAPTEVTENIWGSLWAKLVYSAMQAGQALADATTAEVMATEWVRPICVAIESEVALAARASGVRLEPYENVDTAVLPVRSSADVERALAMLPRGSARQNTYGRDLAAGVRGEIDYVCGEVARIGRAHGLEMPLNAAIARMIHEIEDRTRARAWENLRELEPAARAALAV